MQWSIGNFGVSGEEDGNSLSPGTIIHNQFKIWVLSVDVDVLMSWLMPDSYLLILIFLIGLFCQIHSCRYKKHHSVKICLSLFTKMPQKSLHSFSWKDDFLAMFQFAMNDLQREKLFKGPCSLPIFALNDIVVIDASTAETHPFVLVLFFQCILQHRSSCCFSHFLKKTSDLERKW